MFKDLKGYRTIIVTGPHRSGTTIAAEMIAADTGLPVVLEEAFTWRNIIEAQPLVESGGVIQGPYLLPWLPILADDDTLVIYMNRAGEDIEASIDGLKARGISTPFFSWDQAKRLWEATKDFMPHAKEIEYSSLQDHPKWVENRENWGHRQTN